VGRAAFKKGSTPWVVAMHSHSPHALCPSTFRAPGWGAPVLLSSCCCWRSATLRRSEPFSHRSASRIFIRQPGCIPSPMVTQDGDHRFDGGEKQAGLRPLPRPQLQGSSSPELGRRVGQVGAYLRVGWRPASSSGIRGREPSSSSAEEASSSHAGEGELLLPGQGAAFRPPSWRLGPAAPGVAQHVVRREGGTRVPGLSRSRFCGEDGSEDLPVRFGAAGARRCGVGGQVDAVVGAGVVAAGEGFSADDTVSVTCAPGLWLFGFNGWFLSPVRGHKREPSSGSVRPGAIAAAAEVASEPPGVCRPAGPPMWGLFVPAGVEPEFHL
jgi:hypothetical protein